MLQCDEMHLPRDLSCIRGGAESGRGDSQRACSRRPARQLYLTQFPRKQVKSSRKWPEEFFDRTHPMTDNGVERRVGHNRRGNWIPLARQWNGQPTESNPSTHSRVVLIP